MCISALPPQDLTFLSLLYGNVGSFRHFHNSYNLQPEPVSLQPMQGNIQAVLDSLAADYPEGSCDGIQQEDLLADDEHYFKVFDPRPHHYRYTS